ncbi:MAG: hypothetical protein J6N21_02245, partial [Butyrivibrio sp.]|nr:hypothetical protein [Butyrivibrio sp.]
MHGLEGFVYIGSLHKRGHALLIILCNEITCKIEKNYNGEYKEGILNSNEQYENYTKIILTCFKGNCIGGPIENEHNKNDEDLLIINGNFNNNQNINDENNKDFLNTTIMFIKCFDNICHKNQINDIN